MPTDHAHKVRTAADKTGKVGFPHTVRSLKGSSYCSPNGASSLCWFLSGSCHLTTCTCTHVPMTPGIIVFSKHIHMWSKLTRWGEWGFRCRGLVQSQHAGVSMARMQRSCPERVFPALGVGMRITAASSNRVLLVCPPEGRKVRGIELVWNTAC